MAQYRTGTAVATNASPVITGTNTAWTTSGIEAEDLFAFTGEGVYYTIQSVDSDTQITLSGNYVGQTKTAPVPYQVQVDFTPNNKYPTPTYGDSDTAALIAQTLLQIDQQLAALSPVAPVLQGTITLDGDIEVALTTVKTIGDQTIAVGDLFVDANSFLKIATQVGGQ